MVSSLPSESLLFVECGVGVKDMEVAERNGETLFPLNHFQARETKLSLASIYFKQLNSWNTQSSDYAETLFVFVAHYEENNLFLLLYCSRNSSRYLQYAFFLSLFLSFTSTSFLGNAKRIKLVAYRYFLHYIFDWKTFSMKFFLYKAMKIKIK